ncbi:unnamed protein product [Brachionus calyciflorus]|uniref:Uncharacterized protein n=1 Tax=Brachionus calyciflorus TaxID=104777 RepID=A0A813M3Q7_9BILA|nr:unnamed protein product [Brachionus calyciflorus]
MEHTNLQKEEHPLLKIKPFSELLKKPEFIKMQSQRAQSPIHDIAHHAQEEEDREVTRNLIQEGKSYAEAVKSPEEDTQPMKTQKSESEDTTLPSGRDFLEMIHQKTDESAERELPSITELRGTYLDYQESAPKEPKVKDLPTMDEERESIVDQELKWEKEHGMEPVSKPDLFDLKEIVDYIDQHRNIIEEGLSEADLKRIKVLSDATKDFKSICEETVHHFHDELVELYNKTKRKFTKALSEITSQTEKSKE